MDDLIKTALPLLILVILSGLSSWLKKRGSPEEGDVWTPEAPPPLARSDRSPLETKGVPRPVPSSNWEDELRRLLGESQPPSPPPGPPVIVPEKPAHTTEANIPRPGSASPARSILATEDTEEPSGLPLDLVEARKAHEHALQKQEEVLKRLKLAGSPVVVLPATHRPAVPDDLQNLLAGLRGHSQVRQAFAASIVFGPPKAFE